MLDVPDIYAIRSTIFARKPLDQDPMSRNA